MNLHRAGIFGTEVLTNGKPVFSCLALSTTFRKKCFFFPLNPFSTIQKTTFVRVYRNTILKPWHGASSKKAMQRNEETYFRGKLRLNRSKITFLPRALEMLLKKTSLDPNVAVTSEKHLFSTWSCKT